MITTKTIALILIISSALFAALLIGIVLYVWYLRFKYRNGRPSEDDILDDL